MPVRTICLAWIYDLARFFIHRSRREKMKKRFPFRLKGDGCLVRDLSYTEINEDVNYSPLICFAN